MKILIVHNRYRFFGGEDSVVNTEAGLLREFGHEVREYFESNDEDFGFADAARLYWSPAANSRLAKVITDFAPDVAHCHNVFYRITPSCYRLFEKRGVPVIQTLHNFRFGCANGRLSRDGKPCELCLTGSAAFWPGVRYSCFRNSAAQTFILSSAIKSHTLLGSLSSITTFVALSRYALSKHLAYGIPDYKLVVKPNCIHPDPGFSTEPGSGFCLFAGRLEIDKGIQVLLAALKLIPPEIEVQIAGEGPLGDMVREAAAQHPNLRVLGSLPRPEVLTLMKRARCFLFPSLAYENFPMTIAEAFSVGLPVIASRRGAAAEIISHSVTGMLFEPGSPEGLASELQTLWHDDHLVNRIRTAARLQYETLYSGEAAYRQLISIYDEAIERRSEPAA